MRRTVKAWTLVTPDGQMAKVGLLRFTRSAMRRCRVLDERVVPVTITYDDGRPAPKRRKAKGGKRV